jgi:hypothetical protein
MPWETAQTSRRMASLSRWIGVSRGHFGVLGDMFRCPRGLVQWRCGECPSPRQVAAIKGLGRPSFVELLS